MNDPYRIDQSTPPHPVPTQDQTERRTPGGGPVSTLLWALVAASIGLNAGFSIAGQDVIGSSIGGVAVICLGILLVRYLQRRRQL
ncbi:hypothetical protein [Luteipulveratus mongoliensis]|uniref:hypothetical protein n=1 Tax=Luteipulveratus mongoliensis TaxID=571913 RepID=UPI0009F9C08A|nr:hypothetical protein [Luteipulveratus mongoliensis]